MPANDMLIKLYELTDAWEFLETQRGRGVDIRKPIGPERHELTRWVSACFPTSWVSELEQALSNRPLSCFIATHQHTVVGFACYDATALGFFGPLGVDQGFHGKGIGIALTRACLMDMKLKGYGYAVVGMAASPSFYRKVAGAVTIEESSPGIYRSCIGLPRASA